MKRENKEKFEKMTCKALAKFFKDAYKARIYEILKKAQPLELQEMSAVTLMELQLLLAAV